MLLLSTCFLHQGQFTPTQRRALERVLKAAIRDHVGPRHRLAVAFITVPPGSWYSGGTESSSSLAQVGVPDGFDQTKRAALMRDINAQWCAITGQDPRELMISAVDRTPARKLLGGLLAQVPMRQRPRVLAHHLSQVTRSLLHGRS